jgi:hypothetical protein
MHRYMTWNGPMPTSAAQQAVTTGTSIKTMLQLGVPATRQIQLLSWGFTVDATEAGTVELIQSDTAATVTAHVAAGVQPLTPGQPPSLLTLGTTATGYTSSSETAPVTVRVFDVHKIQAADGASVTEVEKIWVPDARPIVAVSTFVRVRATFGTAVNMTCWICWDE